MFNYHLNNSYLPKPLWLIHHQQKNKRVVRSKHQQFWQVFENRADVSLFHPNFSCVNCLAILASLKRLVKICCKSMKLYSIKIA